MSESSQTHEVPKTAPKSVSEMESVFLEHLEMVERVAKASGQRSGFSDEEVEDFVSTVKLKLIDNDYAVLRKHKGVSRLSTFLVTVIQNLCRDYRNHLWGKFQASATAKRLGKSAEALERLLVRDGLDLESALGIAKSQLALPESRQELEAFAEQLPSRQRREMVDGAVLEFRPAGPETSPQQKVEGARKSGLAVQIEEILDEALAALEPQDLLILKMHLRDGLSLARVARMLRLDQSSLYPRRSRSLRQLRQHFESRGITWGEVSEILGWSDYDLSSILTGTSQDEEGSDPRLPVHENHGGDDR